MFRSLSQAKQHGNFGAEGKLRRNLRAESEHDLQQGRSMRAPKYEVAECPYIPISTGMTIGALLVRAKRNPAMTSVRLFFT